MSYLEGLPSYFWLVSSRLKKPVHDDVPYTTQALREDLLRLRNAWEDCRAVVGKKCAPGFGKG